MKTYKELKESLFEERPVKGPLKFVKAGLALLKKMEQEGGTYENPKDIKKLADQINKDFEVKLPQKELKLAIKLYNESINEERPKRFKPNQIIFFKDFKKKMGVFVKYGDKGKAIVQVKKGTEKGPEVEIDVTKITDKAQIFKIDKFKPRKRP